MNKPNKRVITFFMLVMLNVSIMASLRNLPLVAELGLSAVFYFLLVGLFFLIPCALVSAELATGWPKSGGIYIWVREAFGDTWGFFAVWMQWVHNVSWFPAILSFVAATAAFIFSPTLADNKAYILTTILVLYWAMTYLNYRGIRTSALFSTIGVIGGTILPGIAIICFGLYHLFSGAPSHTELSFAALIPKIDGIGSFVFLAGLFLAFAGLEVSAGYAGEVKNPKRNFPMSIILAAVIVFFLFMLGSLAIAVVIPKEDISLVTGVMEALRVFFKSYHMSWALPIMGVLLILGAIAETNSWIFGPIKALYTSAEHGNLPPFFQTLNRHGMPTNLLILQALIVTVVSLVFIITPSLSASYWILSALSAQMYLVMYIMMFLAAIRLRYSHPHVPRVYEIPSPHKGIWVVSSIGLLSSLFCIILGFFPPQQIDVGNIYFYEGFLIISLLVMMAIPLYIHSHRKPHWQPAKHVDLEGTDGH